MDTVTGVNVKMMIVSVSRGLTDDAIESLSMYLAMYILQLGRAPSRPELQKYITQFLKDRKNGKIR